MAIVYGDGWFRARCCLSEIWDERRARGAHNSRGGYAVAILAGDKPTAFIELNRDYVGVGFLDDFGREFLSYTFSENSPNRLFLQRAVYREFDAELRDPKLVTMYRFEEDGNVTIDKVDNVAGVHRTSETIADVSGNGEPYPEFGCYDSLLRENR